MRNKKPKIGKAMTAELKPVKMTLVTLKENPAFKKQVNKIKAEVKKLNKIPPLIIKSQS